VGDKSNPGGSVGVGVGVMVGVAVGVRVGVCVGVGVGRTGVRVGVGVGDGVEGTHAVVIRMIMSKRIEPENKMLCVGFKVTFTVKGYT